ncbi:hypothetical protein NEILACOT_03514 [Neisseria lactamica ATCC 23970]|uniref:Uncharacterized protein n=1 Tax=Neisseria lactamica ATCC 23970 TaxID=546265 RepID=D0W7L5_NEILA|nr:hypothetical protein NEILACOT_03514 [Neisseria lactamica ATCC 23970]
MIVPDYGFARDYAPFFRADKGKLPTISGIGKNKLKHFQPDR